MVRKAFMEFCHGQTNGFLYYKTELEDQVANPTYATSFSVSSPAVLAPVSPMWATRIPILGCHVVLSCGKIYSSGGAKSHHGILPHANWIHLS